MRAALAAVRGVYHAVRKASGQMIALGMNSVSPPGIRRNRYVHGFDRGGFKHFSDALF